MLNQTRQPTSQAGFTLVELAIVMIIIGLLIAGVLKGQELIGNARVTSTVAQIKSIDAATSTFKDTYATVPGDFPAAPGPATRLPNCTSDCNLAGNGDGAVTSPFGGAPTNEGKAFFPQLSAANLITGIVPGTATFGGDFEAAKIDGVGYEVSGVTAASAATLPGDVAATPAGLPSGMYLAITNTAGAATAAGTIGLTPSQASRIDTKLDDGVLGTGSVSAFGGAVGAGTCANSGASTGVYNTSLNSQLCGVYIKIQG